VSAVPAKGASAPLALLASPTPHRAASPTPHQVVSAVRATVTGQGGTMTTTDMTDPSALLAELLALETAAMDRWGAGDPDGFLELSADDVSYFDPWQPHRVDGLPALAATYESLRGQVQIDSYRFVDPAVVTAGDIAVLSFGFESTGTEGVMAWNTTEVYRRTPGAPGADPSWRIVHTHWSLTEAGPRLEQVGKA
jgi:ketosteroid isomerase-like protein